MPQGVTRLVDHGSRILMDGRNDILRALDAFIRKYYRNMLLRGVLCAVGIVGVVYLAAVLTEHFGWLSSLGRGLLFWGGLAAVVAVVGWLVVRPLLKMWGLSRRRIGRHEAARIAGRHFPEVGDKLLNLLQLMGESGNAEESELLRAAIEQKTAQLRPVPLLNAIDLRANRRYLRYALPPLAVLLVLLVAAPQAVTGPTRRIANYGTAFERPQPFRFVVVQDSLVVAQGKDFDLRVEARGEAAPAEAYIVVEGRRYRMERLSPTLFGYTFRKVGRSLPFGFEGGGVSAEGWTLVMRPLPQLTEMRLAMHYPPYTGRADEVLVGVGDAAVPEGTTVRWLFQTREVEALGFEADGRTTTLVPDASGRVAHSVRVMADMDYAVGAASRWGTRADTLRYRIAAIADAAPMIAVGEVADSLHPDRRLFSGRVKDDYGLSRLVFVHQLTNPQDTARKATAEAEIGLKEGEPGQEFWFSFNMAELPMRPGDRLAYWFEVSDNDAIHGPKTTRSEVFELRVPTEAELDSLLESGSTEARHSAEAQMGELQRLQEEINEMMRRLVDKKELDWQDRKDLEQIQQRQQQVRQMMQQMRQQIDENNRMEQKYREQSEQLMEKQRELDRLMNEVMDEKMKETMAEIERMMQELDKKKVQQELEQLRMNNADLEKQLDQNIELMKRLEVEKKVEQAIGKMERLAEEQRDVSRETEQAKGRDNEDLQQRQQQLNDRFQQMKEEVEQIRQDYKDLDPSTDFKVPTELEQQIEQHQQGAQQDMRRGKNKDAGRQQRQAADEMEQMAEALAEAQLDAEQQDLAEDAEEVRRLLKNLVTLSFQQEELIADLGQTYIQDPRYQTIIGRQNRIKDDFRNVEDSLRSMAKRQVQVASAITREVAEVGNNIGRSLSGLLDMNQSFYGSYRNTQAQRPMQYSMTSLNNLALVLAESLDKMQDQMRQNAQRKNSGQCKNKGKNQQQCNNQGNRPSPKSMRQMQQELNRQMEALKKQLDKQGNQPGNRHQVGQQQSMSEELAKMAAQQEMIRRMMQQYGQEMKQQDAGNGKLAREIDQMMRQMEQTEADLVNRTITRQTIQRQQQIMTRMLQHEKAEMEREKEERRESHEGSELYGQPSADELKRYERLRQQQAADQLRTVPPTLSPFYRSKVSDYFYLGPAQQ